MWHTRVGLFLLVLVVLAGCNAGPGDRTPEPIEVTVHVATVDHEGDRLRAVGVTPREADNWETLRSLFEGVSH